MDHHALRPLRTLGGWVTMLLVVDALIAIVDAGSTVGDLMLLRRVADGDSAFLLEPALASAAARRFLIYVATLAAMTITAFPFLFWFHRAYGNLSALGATPRTTAAWALGGWFIPLGNLYLPHRAAQEIRTLSGNPTSTWVVFGWWTGWLTSALLERLSGFALRDGNLSSATWLHGGAALAAVLSAILGAVFVHRVTRAQSRAPA